MLLFKLVICFLFVSLSKSQQQQEQQDVNPHYAQLLNYSMLFYEAQRSGELPENNRIPWRSDSGLTDGQDNNISLTGGYYDAGNYLKFTVPLSYTLTMLSWGGIEWIDSYRQSGLMNDLRDTIKWGTDWIIKAHPEPNVLFVQVGDGKIDNQYWGPDTGIPFPRPSFMINNSAPGTDAAALASTALSSASHLFRQEFNDTTYADLLLSHAYDLLNFAETARPWQAYSVAVPASNDYYRTNTFQSQLIYANQWLYKVTGNDTYLERANAHFERFNSTLVMGVMDWSDPTGAMLTMGTTLDRSRYESRTLGYLERILDTSKSDSRCRYTEGGLLFCEGYSESNSVMPPLNMAFLLAVLDKNIPSVLSNVSYTTGFIQSQLDYLLGANKMYSPYVCGIHKNSPRNPHHAGASGGTDLKKINTSPKVNQHVLYGAMVGGPDKDDNFYDIRNDYQQTEVAIDYNAPYQSLIAYLMSVNATDPPYVTITEDRPILIPESTEFETWKIVVIIVSLVVGLLVIGGFLFYRKRQKKNKLNEKVVTV